MNIEKTNDLSFYNDQGILTINAKQFDTGRKFTFRIVDNDEPFDLSNCRVYLRMLKADGTQFQGEECCTILNNLITIDTSVSNGSQILACAGKNKCELHLTDVNEKSLTTWTFIINVAPRVHDGSNIVNKDTWDIWDNIRNIVLSIKDDLSSHKNNIDNPHKVTKKQVDLENVPNVSTNDQTPEFDKPTTRENIESGEKLSIIFGKIQKYFSDIKTIAFTGKYTDLTDAPNIPSKLSELENDCKFGTVTGIKGDLEESYRNGNVNITCENIGALAVGATAEKALKDEQGFVINETYAKKSIVGADYDLFNNTNISYSYTELDEDPDVIMSKNQVESLNTAISESTDKFSKEIIKLNDKSIHKNSILNTSEQIVANTSQTNIAGALALKEMNNSLNNRLDQLNSDLQSKIIIKNYSFTDISFDAGVLGSRALQMTQTIEGIDGYSILSAVVIRISDSSLVIPVVLFSYYANNVHLNLYRATERAVSGLIIEVRAVLAKL